MQVADGSPAREAAGQGLTIAVASTFTAEPAEAAIAFWLRELQLAGEIEFAPYNQVFQQLLDPSSVFSRNRHGVNIILLRVEDWLRFERGAGDSCDAGARLARNTRDLIDAVRGATASSSTPLVLAICPSSPAEPPREALLRAAEDQILSELGGQAGVSVIGPRDFAPYPVSVTHDFQREALGHIPYSDQFFTALATALARRVHALVGPAYKVIVLDCDNTLWKGVLGEDGPAGVTLSPAFRRFQEFLVEKSASGFLLCLCSKNEERDVLEVFEHRPDMPLKREHIVAWRINWSPKSENLRALARELNLGLDSFLFLDDNPVECAEVRTGCPEVLALQLPPEEELERFLDHLWPLDRIRITSEDQQRTAMYRENAERSRFERHAQSFEEFLAGLELQVTIAKPEQGQLERVAQLTQRTNQFNFTTIRRTEAEIRQLGTTGKHCLIVDVNDRFGHYGLVGVMVYSESEADQALEVDTFLLSCRVLGRGVEQRMLRELGEIAVRHGLAWVEATLRPTRKNQPARDFLDSVAGGANQSSDGNLTYRFPAELAAGLSLCPSIPLRLEDETTVSKTNGRTGLETRKIPPYARIARELSRPDQIMGLLAASSSERRPRPLRDTPLAPPRTESETEICRIWAELLRLEEVGINDDYFDLGGTSLLAVDLLARIENRFGVRLPLTTLVEAPTVALLGKALDKRGSSDSLVLIRQGTEGKPPLFLVHDGEGETLLYRNLALRLDPEQSVYGLQPYSQPNYPILHTRLDEMAAFHIRKIRSVQERGPYLLGGMCAGAVIAFEIARQLQHCGEEVALVALFDAAEPTAKLKPLRFARQRLQSFSGSLNEGTDLPVARRVVSIAGKALGKARRLATYLVASRVHKISDASRIWLLRQVLDRGWKLPGLLKEIPVRTVYSFAERDYSPETPFKGELTLFRATSGEGNDEPFTARYVDPLLGWEHRATQGVRFFDVPGGHSSMLQEPEVQVLAEALREQIDEVLATRTAAELIG